MNKVKTSINPNLIGTTKSKVSSPLDNINYNENSKETPITGKALIYLNKKLINSGNLVSQLSSTFFKVKHQEGNLTLKYSTRYSGPSVPHLVIV